MSDDYIRREDAVNTVIPAMIDGADAEIVEGLIYMIEPADVVPVCRCKDCIHNNDCDIQHSAQAGENFFCGFGETEKDVREDVYE